jgi:O-antigen/teichoic acid export membrane protein
MISLRLKSGTLLGGIGVTGGWFAVSRVLQLASGLWITKQLAPGDFTLLATVFAIQGFAQQVTTINLSSHLVRAAKVEAADLTVAWSYEAIRNLLIFGLIFALAPYLAMWMGRPDATLPLKISAAGLLIGALRNPRLVELRRDGKFGLLGALDAIPAIAYALLAVGLVIAHKSYWSLIYAGLGAAVISIITTYIGLPWKPSLNFDTTRAGPMFKFGVVILAGTGFAALREHGMVFIISKSAFVADLGYYNRALAFSLALAMQGHTKTSEASLLASSVSRASSASKRRLLPLIALKAAIALRALTTMMSTCVR